MKIVRRITLSNAAQNFKGTYVCSDCGHEFEFEFKKIGTPYCLKCKSVNLTAVTPIVNDGEKDKRTLLQTDKKKKYIIRNYRNYKKLEAHVEGLKNMMQRLEVPEQSKFRCELALRNVLQSLDELHKKRIQEYERSLENGLDS